MAEFKMPSLGADMDAGTLLEWYVKPGDPVKRGDIVALVDTDKAAIEVEVFEDGVVSELLVPPGEKVPVGTPLATIVAEGEAPARAAGAEATGVEAAGVAAAGAAGAPGAPEPGAAAPPEGAPGRAVPPAAPPTAETPAAAPAEPPTPGPQPGTDAVRPLATPAARSHARELGVDLSAVTGTGKHGVITAQDVEAAAGTRAPAGAATGVAAGVAAGAAGAAAYAARPGGGREPAAAPPGQAPAPNGRRVRASPLARRLAERLHVDLTLIRGTGPGGAVTQADVEAAAGGPAGPAPAAPRKPAREGAEEAPEAALTATVPAASEAPRAAAPAARAPAADERYAAMRRAIAAAMSKSKREIPHYYLSQHVDMRAALAWLEDANLQRAVTERLLPAALLLKATALAAREVPDVNGFYGEAGFQPSEAVHLGVGISLRQGGLIAPAIHDADAKDLDTLMADLRDLVKRARSLQLKSSEMTDATMTTTMLGDQGVENVYGIIYPPQVALVGFGRVVERPWAENGMLAVRPILHVTLAADHRASDGHRGGLFLSAIERHLHHPEEL